LIHNAADVVVAGDGRHPKQSVRVRTPPAGALGQRLLVSQKRRALHEENGKCRQPDVRHRVAPVAARPSVRQPSATLPQRRDVALKPVHQELESHPDSARKLFLDIMRTAG
jgi:hypothetical protein